MFKKINFFILLMSCSLMAFAADNTQQTKTEGYYLEANAGYARVNEAVEINGASSSKTDNTGFGINGNAGYQFNKYFATEIGATRYPDADFGEADATDNYSVDIALKGIWPITNEFNVFGKLGPAWVHHSLKVNSGDLLGNHSSNAFTAYGAIGIGYFINSNLETTLQGSTTTKNESKGIPAMQLVSLGLTYIF